jgi:hypothetical protein
MRSGMEKKRVSIEKKEVERRGQRIQTGFAIVSLHHAESRGAVGWRRSEGRLRREARAEFAIVWLNHAERLGRGSRLEKMRGSIATYNRGV